MATRLLSGSADGAANAICGGGAEVPGGRCGAVAAVSLQPRAAGAAGRPSGAVAAPAAPAPHTLLGRDARRGAGVWPLLSVASLALALMWCVQGARAAPVARGGAAGPAAVTRSMQREQRPSAWAHVDAREQARTAAGQGACPSSLGVDWHRRVEGESKEVCSVGGEGPAATGVGIRCLRHTRSNVDEAHCIARSLRINPAAAVEWVSRPGYDNPNKVGQPAELEVALASAMGRMPSECRGKMPPVGHGGQKLLKAIVNGAGGSLDRKCTLTVRDPVLFAADKYGENNPWHAMEDTLHAFTMLATMHFPHDRTRIILADRPVSGPPVRSYMGMWDFVWDTMSGAHPVSSLGELLLNATQLAGAVSVPDVTDSALRRLLESPSAVTANRMRSVWAEGGDAFTLCFDKATFNVHGGASALSESKGNEDRLCQNSPFVLGLVDLVLSRIDGGGAAPASHAVRSRSERALRVLYVSRGGARTASKARRVADPAALEAALRAIPGTTVSRVSFDDVSKAEQLAAIRAADVLVGVHGAALTWEMFLPEPSAVVEINAQGSGVRCHCFDNLARWSGHPYRLAPQNGNDYTQVVGAVRDLLGEVHAGIEARQR